MNPTIQQFFHPDTFTFSYVVSDPATKRAAVIDSVLDYDEKSGHVATDAADNLIAYLQSNDLAVDWILETHAHADHLSAAQHIKTQSGGDTGIGANIQSVQEAFRTICNLRDDFRSDGSQFDRLFDDDDTFRIGNLDAQVLHTPGHTGDSVTYVVGDAAFIGDTMFMPDSGTARCDFPGGDAKQLYQSIKRILSLPSSTRLFMCHDYGPGGRDYRWETTVADQKMNNIHVHDGVAEDEYVAMRRTRDAELRVPSLLLPAVQVNIRAGRLPDAESNGSSYLKISLNSF